MKYLALVGLIAVGASAHATMIDDFMTGSYNSGAISAGTVNSWTNAASALGGNRYQSLSVITNPLGGDAKCRVITTDRQTGRQTDTQTHSQTHRQTHRHTDRHTDTQTDTQKKFED